MFTTLVVQPIFNLLVLIYGVLPGHNFGLALILFTVVIRMLMWPLVKKQLHQTKVMRKLQPEMKRIKAAAKGDRQKEGQLMMELYKERGVNPFSAFPTLIIQFIVLIGLYSGLTKVIKDPHNLISFAYDPLQHLPYLQELSKNIKLFDNTLFGFVDLSRSALGKDGVYWPAMILVVGSAVTQYFQSGQLLPTTKDSRSLRQILREAGNGKQADQTEVNAAVGRSTRYFLPAIVFIGTVNFASALGLYWFIGGLVAYIQQAIVLRDDGTEMEAMADKAAKKDLKAIPEAEVVEAPVVAKTSTKLRTAKKSAATKKAKRRKK